MSYLPVRRRQVARVPRGRFGIRLPYVHEPGNFGFDVPPGLVAPAPAGKRCASRQREVALEVRVDRHFTHLPALLERGDLAD